MRQAIPSLGFQKSLLDSPAAAAARQSPAKTLPCSAPRSKVGRSVPRGEAVVGAAEVSGWSSGRW